MKRNVLLVPFFAVLALAFASVASALGPALDIQTEFNNVKLSSLSSNAMSGWVGEVVPVRVVFTAAEDVSDVRVRVYMEGHRDDVFATTERFHIEKDIAYTKVLSLRLPSDLRELSEDFTLYVEVVSRTERSEERYLVRMQRTPYTYRILSVDFDSRVSAGDVVPVSVVVKNTGYDRMDDTYVVVSIPALGISARSYMGDLAATDRCVVYRDNSQFIIHDCDQDDSAEKIVSLRIPANAERGVYEMVVRAFNPDGETVVTKSISVDGVGLTQVLPVVKSRDLNAGETVTYDLIIVNLANNVRAFNINAVSGNALTVSVPSVVTVGPNNSERVTITVTASDNAEVGTYTFSVNVDGEQAVFGANVVSRAVSTSIVALTVILVIIFIVLLAVLVVLLTRKEKPMEEVETSYY
jgi:hypothetical protein